MGTKESFIVYGREIPSDKVEALIKRLCESLEDWSFSLNREEILIAALIAVK